MLHGSVKRLDSPEQDSGRCEVTMETLYSFHQESEHRGFGTCGVLKDPCGYRGMTVALGAVPGTTSAQRLNCHHQHPTGEETEARRRLSESHSSG